jgi:hypothetical protein
MTEYINKEQYSIEELKKAKQRANYEDKKKIQIILLLYKGTNVSQISKYMGINEVTIQWYIDKYNESGLDKLIKDRYKKQEREPRPKKEKFKEVRLNKSTGLYIYLLLIISVISFIIVGINFLSGSLSDIIIDSITIEAGAEIPKAEMFLINENSIGKFITDIYAIDTGIVGTVKIELEIDAKKYGSLLIIEDTIPPKAEPVEQYIFINNEIQADDFVTELEDVTQVSCTFAVIPDVSKPGWQDVTVILTDEGYNNTEVNSRLHIFDVVDEFIIEAGIIHEFSANDFISNYIEIENLFLDMQIGEVDLSKLGSYSITLAADKYSVQAVVKVVDTTPPTAEPAEQYIFMGYDIQPDELVKNIIDATQVTRSFASPPDVNKPGWQDVTIILTDEGNNQTGINSRFYVFDVINELQIELGTGSGIKAESFIKNYESEEIELYLDGEIDLSTTGAINLALKSSNYSVPVTVNIADTTPPVASIRNSWAYKGKSIPAANFVDNIIDASPVTVRYKNQPDFSVEGTQTVYLILEDAHENMREYAAELSVVVDTAPPVISGALDKWVIAGGKINYNSGITVTDDYDNNVQLIVDSGGVNLNIPGSYTVIYSAADASGNRAEATGVVTVQSIDMALVNDMADEILAGIINDSMSHRDKAKAIYDWVHQKIRYTAGTPQNVAQAAYAGFTSGRGDCYAYMAVSHVMLTRAGIPNVTARRYSSVNPTQHYWNIIDVGTGWHHFDVCPTPGNGATIEQRFLFTESQAVQYTTNIASRSASKDYYKYDKSTVPEVVE